MMTDEIKEPTEQEIEIVSGYSPASFKRTQIEKLKLYVNL